MKYVPASPLGVRARGKGEPRYPDAIMHEILLGFVSLNARTYPYLTSYCAHSDNSSVPNLSLYIRARMVQDKGRKA